MAGTFVARIRELRAQVGDGEWDAIVEFNQVYAHRQHEEMAWVHPHGGGPKYLERALYENIPEYMELIAANLLYDIEFGMREVAEHLADLASGKAPERMGDLRHSDHPSVTHNGELVYDRPPLRERKSQAQIEADNRAMNFNPRHWYGAWPPDA
jgi:hypothetical protein